MRKKSIKLSADTYLARSKEVATFVAEVETWRRAANPIGTGVVIRCYEQALLEHYRDFEVLVFDCLVALLNHDSNQFRTRGQRQWKLPRHMPVELCELVICKGGYFDFSGRDGLLREINSVVGKRHWMYTTINDKTNNTRGVALDQLVVVRNFVAHQSYQSAQQFKRSTGAGSARRAGHWLAAKRGQNLVQIRNELELLAIDIKQHARF